MRMVRAVEEVWMSSRARAKKRRLIFAVGFGFVVGDDWGGVGRGFGAVLGKCFGGHQVVKMLV